MMEENKDDTSGYFDDLEKEVSKEMASLASGKFSNIETLYESGSGYAVVMTGIRYGKRYALKGLKSEYRYNPVHRLALQKEFEIGIWMSHPNIVQTVGFEEIDGVGTVIVMEYVDGITLEQLMKDGDVSMAKARTIASQLADALAYIHSKGVIHRDLKPSNIMVTHAGGNVKLIDFSLSDSNVHTIIKSQAGTRAYMAPELCQPGAKSNIKTDLYALGIILHDLAVKTGDRKLLAASRRCTEKDPLLRASSAGELEIPDAPSTSKDTSGILDSEWLTWVLASIAVLLVFILCLRALS